MVMSALVFMPYEPLQNFYAKFGFALIKESMEYDCRANGFCGEAPATAAFTARESHIMRGFLLGFGYQMELAYLSSRYARFFARFGYDHIFVRSEDFQAGTAASRYVAGLVKNDIDRFYITLALTLGGQDRQEAR